ncbi:MAG: hypothetical protein JNM00_16425 [Flavobacteriales bacterium]|nr:hypothetical protein [Flavobacteriales bacterium]
MKTNVLHYLITGLFSLCVFHASATDITSVVVSSTGEATITLDCVLADPDVLVLDFGDGSTMDIVPGTTIVTHLYAGGSYTICLMTQGGAQLDCETIVVCVLPEVMDAAISGNSVTLLFGPGAPVDPDYPVWPPEFSIDWGDGMLELTTSYHPSHTYALPGNYTICATATCPLNGESTTLCNEVETITDLCDDCAQCLSCINPGIVVLPPGCDVLLGLPSDPADPTDPMAPWPIFSVYWGDGTMQALTELTTQHHYEHSGEYNITLVGLCENGSTGSHTELVSIIGCDSGCNLPTGFDYAYTGNNTIEISAIEFALGNGNLGGSEDLEFYWSFGDGTFSTEAMPTHTYPGPGVFTVCWTVECQGVQVTLYEAVTIKEPLIMPTEFLYEVDGLTLTITDIIIPGYSGMVTEDYVFEYAWGDGTFTSGVFASHTYPAPGDYVCCIPGWDGESGEFVGFLYLAAHIPEPECPYNILIAAAPIDEVDELTYAFSTYAFGIEIDRELYPDAWSLGWDFGDGHTSWEAEPVHTFETAGLYPVCFFVECMYTGEIIQVCDDVLIGSQPCEDEVWAVSRFEAQVNGNTFTPFSGNAEKEREAVIQQTFWTYHYGDGTTGSTPNEEHTYDYPGEYEVSQTYGVLWADGLYAEDTWSQVVTIACPGDLDGNGTRNIADLLLMMATFGQECGAPLLSE